MEDYKMSEQLIATPSEFGENGNFLLERELGSGGMGGVYMGRDKMLDRQVAVKVMLREFGDDEEFVEKFKKEAQSAARLIHPNIAQVYSYGICDGMPYISMELACGGSLYSIMNNNKGTTDIARVLKICQQVAQALQCASDQGFVHGDVKPENILLDSNGNAKLVDFGLAGMQKNTDEIWGTPYYISPEKVRKEEVDFRSDMYCLGGTLYHALTGVAPFEGEDSVAVVKKRFEGAPKKPSEIRPEITPAIDNLVMRMLALNKEDRFPSFEALLKAFSDVLTSGLTLDAKSAGDKPAAQVVQGKKPARGRIVAGRRTMAMKKRLSNTKTADAENDAKEKTASIEEDDTEENGNLGAKVALFVVGGILAIAGIAGLLVWYQVADKRSRENERIAMINANISKAREAIADTRRATEKFNSEFGVFAATATIECEKITESIGKQIPDVADLLKPPQSKELIDAINLTNKVIEAKGDAVSATSATNAPVASAQAQPAEQETDKKIPAVVKDIHELWERAYSCQASEIKVGILAQNVLKECDKAAAISGNSENDMRTLGQISIEVKDLYDRLCASKDVENVRKGIAYIKSRGKKTIEQTAKRLAKEKFEAKRAADAAAKEAAEKERLKKQEEEQKLLIEKEIQEIKDKFAVINEQGSFRQLDWKSAERQLKAVKETFKTAEGSIAADLELRKVYAMKSVQDILIAKLKGHVFKGKMKGFTVTAVSEKEIQIKRPGIERVLKLSWQNFYRKYPGNLNEVLNLYIVNGRKNSNLNLKNWANAMVGSALTMQLICFEVNGAIERAEQLVKEVVMQFPDYSNVAKEIFPNIKFENSTEE